MNSDYSTEATYNRQRQPPDNKEGRSAGVKADPTLTNQSKTTKERNQGKTKKSAPGSRFGNNRPTDSCPFKALFRP